MYTLGEGRPCAPRSWRGSCWRRAAGRPAPRAEARGTTATSWRPWRSRCGGRGWRGC